MSGHNINANLTAIITEARNNVGISQKLRGEKGVTLNTLQTPPIFPQLCINFMMKNHQIIFPKGVRRTPPENAFILDTFSSIVLLVNVETVLSAIMNVLKKIFSDTKMNPNPPLSQSGRGPTRDPNQKDFERGRVPSSGQE
jgi:hypothetical protein